MRILLKTLVGLALFIGFCVVPSLPELWADHQRTRHAECGEGLRAVMQRFAELQDGGVADGGQSPNLTLSLSALASAVPGGRRQPYTYVLGEGVTVPPLKDAPDEAERVRQLGRVTDLVQPGLRGTCPACQLTVACVGNTDGDDELDVLSVSSAQRYVFGSSPVAPGEIYVQSKDFAHDSELPLRFEPEGLIE